MPLLMLCLVALLSLGCVERRLIITSEPPGALVYLNDREQGRTPLEVPFTWYGVYDVRLEREGYTTLLTQREAERPWWEAPGPDLFAEAIPDKRVEIRWHLEMQQATPADETDPLDIIGHARQLRAKNLRDE
ncbi:MAG: PEGA domain-containing protein [Phycisphaeraceae bacterium]